MYYFRFQNFNEKRGRDFLKEFESVSAHLTKISCFSLLPSNELCNYKAKKYKILRLHSFEPMNQTY